MGCRRYYVCMLTHLSAVIKLASVSQHAHTCSGIAHICRHHTCKCQALQLKAATGKPVNHACFQGWLCKAITYSCGWHISSTWMWHVDTQNFYACWKLFKHRWKGRNDLATSSPPLTQSWHMGSSVCFGPLSFALLRWNIGQSWTLPVPVETALPFC